MNNNLGRFRLSVDRAARCRTPTRCRRGCGASLAVPGGEAYAGADRDASSRTGERRCRSSKRTNDTDRVLWKQWPAGATSLVVQARDEPRTTHLLKRGNFLKPGDEVAAGVPAFLQPLPDTDATPSRLTFASWLADKNSPTTARAFVNRVWQAYFGTGLVDTPEEFGTQGEKPSHPGTARLAGGRVHGPRGARRGPIKHLHRLIVNSSTYRQSSKVTPELLASDPQNRLLARGPRFRVDGEIVRDIALSASGAAQPEDRRARASSPRRRCSCSTGR